MIHAQALPAVIFEYHFYIGNRFHIDTINDSVERLLGITSADCLEQPERFLQQFSEYADSVKNVLIHTCTLFSPQSLEIPFGDKFLLLQTAPIDADTAAGTGLIVDITAQCEAREKAFQKTKFLISAQDQLEDLFYYKDRQSRFLGGNLAWCHYHGEDNPRSLIGKSDLDSKVLDPAIKKVLYDEEQEMMRTGSSIRRRERTQLLNGKVMHLESVKTSLCNSNGEVIGLVGISRDITAQVKAEMALEKSREEAQQLAQVKSSFLAVMSHEIRTPMNGVIGCASLLSETELDEEQQQLLHTIQSSGESLLVIINDILDYSKIDANKMEFDHSPFDLRTLIEECLELFGKQVNEKGLQINYLLTPEVPATLLGDSSRIRQVINNLLSNAIKFTEKGEIFTEVGVLSLDADKKNCELIVAVKDTGIGISKEQQEHLFNAFSQADSSITRRYGGTGLGLAISKKIIEQMGGRLWCESKVDRGSTFFISVKIDYDDQHEHSDLLREIESVKNLRALIVDDNATNRRVLSSTLLQWGMQVAAFNSPETTLENLDLGQCYDLVLLDFCMPNMDGGELAEKIKRYPSMSAAPIIILSSAQISKYEFPQLDAVLLKPVRTATLKRALLQAIGQEAATANHSHNRNVKNNVSRILVVEDNRVNQMVITMMLKKLGYQNVSCVADGQEAIYATDHREIDIVLMDIQMDRMDGYTATRMIREKKANQTRPWIIAITAGAQKEDSDKAYAAGMNDFITKPIQLQQLESVLNNACGN